MNDYLALSGAPSIPGLGFRKFSGGSDFQQMAEVYNASVDADQVEAVMTVADVENSFAYMVNSDPYQDMVFAEMDGQVIGVVPCLWSFEEGTSNYHYRFFGCLAPAWRRKGIGQALLQWCENRLRVISSAHPVDQAKFFDTFVFQNELGKAVMLEKNGYVPSRYYYEMLRPDLNGIPHYPLPEGLEIRPVLPEHYRLIWEAGIEAFLDHWGYVRPAEEYYQLWLNNKNVFQPQLWQVAWDIAKDQIAGQVRTFIIHEENEKYQRKSGYTEFVSVRSLWRRRGLAHALIACSLAAQKENGMTASKLHVDTENLSGAVRLYEDCGFRIARRNTVYRKPL